jgi:hypothetical protein
MRTGYFTLELVNRETGWVYQEHKVQNGDKNDHKNDHQSCQTYAEIQWPRESYYVRLLQISPEDLSVDLLIDGQLVERRRRLKSGIIYRLGRLQKKNHSTKDHQSQARLFDSSILQQSNKTGTVHFNLLWNKTHDIVAQRMTTVTTRTTMKVTTLSL